MNANEDVSTTPTAPPRRKGTWYHKNYRLDPWSYRNLLRRAKRLGVSPSVALRYTLRRIRD